MSQSHEVNDSLGQRRQQAQASAGAAAGSLGGSPPGGVLLLSIQEAARSLGVGRTKTYELISAGEIEVVHIGRCARVPVDAVEAYVERLRARVTGRLACECPACAGEPAMESWGTARWERRSALPATGATPTRARRREPDGQHHEDLDDGRDAAVPGPVVG